MNTSEIIIITLVIISTFFSGAALFISIKSSKKPAEISRRGLEEIKREFTQDSERLKEGLDSAVKSSVAALGSMLNNNQINLNAAQNDKLLQLDRTINSEMHSLESRFKAMSSENEQRLEGIRNAVEVRLNYIREDNNKRLDEMRGIVDEKLQKTLESRLTHSFTLVNDRLEQVYKGLGEMQTLASGVGDLKKVLSGVKTRGILGEIQLGSILKEILAPEQYAENVMTKKGSRDVVEFAVKFPADNNEFVYLPIDSKFPGDTYSALLNAYESGDKEEISRCSAALASRIKSEAKDINTKYIAPPYTTDFAILFLPFEGLYSEVVNMGMVEVLQRDYKVNIAGPSTMAALLNSLQMGFKTLAVQQRSAEVWKTLESVKVEFDNFAAILEKTQRNLEQANSELDKLIGVRTRQIQRKLCRFCDF